MGHTLAVLITLCLSPSRAPDSGSAWNSLLARGFTILRSQVSTLLLQNLAHLNRSIVTSMCQEGVEAWKVMLLDWLKGRWATDSGRQSRTLAGVGTGCSYLVASLSTNVGLWCPPSPGCSGSTGQGHAPSKRLVRSHAHLCRCRAKGAGRGYFLP